MKTTIFLILSLCLQSAWAGVGSRVILKDSKTFQTEVSYATVRCSEIGYGAKELKINLAALDGWTLFDHSNSQVGEFGEPCMSAGPCKSAHHPTGFTLDNIIQHNPDTDTVTVEREVIEVKYNGRVHNGAGGEMDVCVRQLIENLKTKVRGVTFTHTRSGATENFPIIVCRR